MLLGLNHHALLSDIVAAILMHIWRQNSILGRPDMQWHIEASRCL